MSGSRLPGDSAGSDRHSPGKKRLETRVGTDQNLRERVENALPRHDSEADLVRAALDEYLPDDEVEYVLPSDPELAKAYRGLAEKHERKMDMDDAVSSLCEDTFPSTSKETVERLVRRIPEPFVAVKWGRIAVAPLTPVDEVLNN
jgi:hypothetical protein